MYPVCNRHRDSETRFLRQVISRKETLYIAALSSVKRAADTPAAPAPPKVTIVQPSPVPPASLEKEEAAAQDVASLVEESTDAEDLDTRFLDMERTTLERMYTQSPSAAADRCERDAVVANFRATCRDK